MIVQIGDRPALEAVCERLGEHLWSPIGDKTVCGVCGAINLDGQGFAGVFAMYDLYLRGLVDDAGDAHEGEPKP